MAEISVAPQSTLNSNSNSNSGGYQLYPAHRAAILAGSDSAKQAQKIERQRQEFTRKNGDDGTH